MATTDIIVNVSNDPEEIEDDLVKWVVATVEPWEDYREDNFETPWKEYYKEWKTVWTANSKTRDSERSRFIAPALGQAVEMAVAEMEEATFNRKYWIDIDDNVVDEQKGDMELIREQLIEDFAIAHIPKAISEIYLNGAIYGTGIGKIVVTEKEEKVMTKDGPTDKTRVEITLEPVHPENFVIDPSARNVNEGKGCAHIVIKSKVDIIKKQESGVYLAGDIGSYVDDEDVTSKGETRSTIIGDRTEIIEYHGLVPSGLLNKPEDEDELDDLIFGEDTDMIEAIVTIANRGTLLKAVENPFLMRDRSIIAYQHDTVPNRFWGRGICEKGIHSQRGLNAELRARQDGLALTIHPMMAIDSTKIPRGFKPAVGPGKTLFSTGDPRQTFFPMHFGDMGTHTYKEAAEFQIMMQQATGSMDTAMPVGTSPRNSTASGMSQMGASSIKRSKRTMRNIEEDFLKPLIMKSVWRYEQFDSERYPYNDYKFIPYSTMGIMAREFEQSNLVNLLNAIPPGPAAGIILKGIVENSSIQDKAALDKAIDTTYNPPEDPYQKIIKDLSLEKLKKEVEKLDSEAKENYATAEEKSKLTDVKRFTEIAKVEDGELDRQAYGQNDGN